VGLFIAHCRFPIANLLLTRQAIGIWQLAIGNATAHPLPRGGTDFIGTEPIAIQRGKCISTVGAMQLDSSADNEVRNAL